MANQLAQMKTKSKGLSSKIIGFENVLSCQLNGVLIFCYIAKKHSPRLRRMSMFQDILVA